MYWSANTVPLVQAGMGNRTILSPLKLTLERGAGLQATRHSVTDEAHFMKAAVVALT